MMNCGKFKVNEESNVIEITFDIDEYRISDIDTLDGKIVLTKYAEDE